MPTFESALERDMILFVGSFSAEQKDSLDKLSIDLGKRMVACILLDIAKPEKDKISKHFKNTVVLRVDFSSHLNIEKVILPYKHRFLAVTCRSDKNVPLLRAIAPHIPYIHTPSVLSLDWTTNKILMRKMLRQYDKSISPKFMVVNDDTPATLQKIEKNIGFPLIIKPAGLAKSLLVTFCYHQEELEQNLKNTVKKIHKIYKQEKGRGEPKILVEEYMEGSMYSVDSYVNHRGVIYHTPLVHVRTGRAVGYDDLFGYARLTPVKLRPHRADRARKVAESAINALNLRSVTCHTELMRTEEGWKVIEVGARMGGFRDEMYKMSYGIDHSTNDILIRIPKKPVINKKSKGYTVVMQFYAYKKGRLEKLEGINKIRRLESFSRINIKKKVGDLCDFARNGDSPIFDLVMFNKSRSNLLADIRRVEKTINIVIKKPKRADQKAK